MIYYSDMYRDGDYQYQEYGCGKDRTTRTHRREMLWEVYVVPRAPAHAPQRDSHGNTVSRACAHEAREKGERKKRVSPGHGESRIYINILIFARTSTHTSPTEAGRGDTDIGREPGIDTVGCPYQRPQKERART